MAKKIIRFRLSHLKELLAAAEEEDMVMQSQCRDGESFNVYYDEDKWLIAKKKLATWKRDMPGESRGFRVVEKKEVAEVSFLVLESLIPLAFIIVTFRISVYLPRPWGVYLGQAVLHTPTA
jgi:hypothetical protein